MDATIEHTSAREHLRSERVEQLSGTHTGSRHRARLLAGLPVAEGRLQLAGVSTAVLERRRWAADRLVGRPRRLRRDVDAGHPGVGDYIPRHRPGSGGAIAARFAVNHSQRLSRLVLVDSLGLARLRPAPTFALTMIAFLMRPTERTYARFMRQCSFNLDGLREELGTHWEPFLAYSLERARGPASKIAGRAAAGIWPRVIANRRPL